MVHHTLLSSIPLPSLHQGGAPSLCSVPCLGPSYKAGMGLQGRHGLQPMPAPPHVGGLTRQPTWAMLHFGGPFFHFFKTPFGTTWHYISILFSGPLTGLISCFNILEFKSFYLDEFFCGEVRNVLTHWIALQDHHGACSVRLSAGDALIMHPPMLGQKKK